jgi:pimeloyl-ACP methyl ester carboxylesterase
MGRSAWRSARAEEAAFAPRRGPVARPEISAELDGLADATFSACGGTTLRGWWVPSKNGAAVVLVHGTEADRHDMLDEMRVLTRAGYGVLAYDQPGHGESDGVVTFGRCEVEAAQRAVEDVAQRPGVDPARVGALGASAGGAVVAVASAGAPRMRALALVAAYTDSDEQTRWAFRSWVPLSASAAVAVDHAHMIDGPLRPIDAMPKTKARAVLVIEGTEDPVVPPAMAGELHAAAAKAGPAINETWMIEHGRHLRYDELTSGRYGARLVSFFDQALGSP